jgi:FtsP/CotA-like multicopper oxidase with cupredoxin domain
MARREGDRQQTGIVLAAPGAAVAKVPPLADRASVALDINFEGLFVARAPLAPRRADVTHKVALTGGMVPFKWTINDRTWEEREPLMVASGDRVVLELENRTTMSHPVHLHGHHFQVVGLNEREVSGAVRDTVLVPAMGRVTVAFDADNPGRWLFHCHTLYHMATGMMGEIRYTGAA